MMCTVDGRGSEVGWKDGAQDKVENTVILISTNNTVYSIHQSESHKSSFTTIQNLKQSSINIFEFPSDI
jgi:hypothetical protein